MQILLTSTLVIAPRPGDRRGVLQQLRGRLQVEQPGDRVIDCRCATLKRWDWLLANVDPRVIVMLRKSMPMLTGRMDVEIIGTDRAAARVLHWLAMQFAGDNGWPESQSDFIDLFAYDRFDIDMEELMAEAPQDYDNPYDAAEMAWNNSLYTARHDMERGFRRNAEEDWARRDPTDERLFGHYPRYELFFTDTAPGVRAHIGPVTITAISIASGMNHHPWTTDTLCITKIEDPEGALPAWLADELIGFHLDALWRKWTAHTTSRRGVIYEAITTIPDYIEIDLSEGSDLTDDEVSEFEELAHDVAWTVQGMLCAFRERFGDIPIYRARELITDWYRAHPNEVLHEMDLFSALGLAIEAHKDMTIASYVKQEDPAEILRTLYEQEKELVQFSDGAKIVEILGTDALAIEGKRMGHCVGTEGYGHPKKLRNRYNRVFSYRDPDGRPKVTWAMRWRTGLKGRNDDLQGPHNGPIHDEDARVRMLWFMSTLRSMTCDRKFFSGSGDHDLWTDQQDERVFSPSRNNNWVSEEDAQRAMLMEDETDWIDLLATGATWHTETVEGWILGVTKDEEGLLVQDDEYPFVSLWYGPHPIGGTGPDTSGPREHDYLPIHDHEPYVFDEPNKLRLLHATVPSGVMDWLEDWNRGDRFRAPPRVYFVSGLDPHIARYVDGTSNEPVILIDWEHFYRMRYPDPGELHVSWRDDPDDEVSEELGTTVLHELAHAVMDSYGINDGSELCEEIAELHGRKGLSVADLMDLMSLIQRTNLLGGFVDLGIDPADREDRERIEAKIEGMLEKGRGEAEVEERLREENY